jgi:hypothetical protein
MATLLLLGLALLPAMEARAQPAQEPMQDGMPAAGILAPGDAVVTGFSGIQAPDRPLPEDADPLDGFHIDVEGPSAQVFQLGVPGGPPQGQLLSVAAAFKARAREVGQVFPIALDDGPVPNIYLGQTSAFGLQIVGPDGDGDGRPERLKQGGPDAEWMPGQFGTDTGGGPGSIYRIDGRTGSVSVFATVPGNGGAGLGDIAFDKASRHFFVSDLDSGLIHRLDANGQVLDSYDHGTAGRAAGGLPPVPDDGMQADIKDNGFSVEDPATWGLTPKPRMVWGMAVHDGRLYYAVADGPAIWSVGIGADGAFAGDPREELQVADTPAGHAVSDIAFDGEGRMYLAQRGEIRGSYDYSVFAEPEQSVVRRYRREAAADPAMPATWVPAPEEYAIGFPAEHRNTSGGIALGYAHDETGSVRRGSCGGTLWSTGDALRNDEKQAAKLGDEGPLDVHGLQGAAAALVRPQNEPPAQSYFIDYDGKFGDVSKAGHVGDVEIWQPCEGSPGFGQLYPGYPPPGFAWHDDWIPPWIPPPPPEHRKSNLKVDKRPLFCWSIGGGKHRCAYRITVTNTGPNTYHDHIVVRDTIPAAPGVTATFSSAKFGCAGGPPSYTCSTIAPQHLHPFEQVVIIARVDVPNAQAKALGCRIRNHARILFAPSPSSKNTDPTDDADDAMAFLPPHLCEEPKNNLRLSNVPLGDCIPVGGGKHRCDFVVRVRNLGPAVYNDKIEVTDKVPTGTTAGFFGGWNCAGPAPTFACKHNPVVLNPPTAIGMKVSVFVSAQRAKELNCKVTNRAKIDHAPGGSPTNTNPADDQGTAIATVPDLCDPPAALSNLQMVVGLYGGAQPSDCPLAGGATWCKRFRMVVQNTGPDPFKGKIKVLNVPLGLPGKVAFAPAPKWSCNAATRICTTSGEIVLAKDSHTPVFNVHVSGNDQDAKAMNCKVKNRGEILSPVGPPRNVKKADDTDEATYDLPAHMCLPPALTNLKLHVGLYGGAISPECPLSGGATWCRRFRVAVENTGPGTFNGPIKIHDSPPGGVNVHLTPLTPQWTCNDATRFCQTVGGVVMPKNGISNIADVLISGDDNDAKANGCQVFNKAKILSPLGLPKNIKFLDNQDSASYKLPLELCAMHSKCPPGFQWLGDRCGPVIVPTPPPQGCPPGTKGRHPDCKGPPVVVIDPTPQVCPRGTVGNWPHCTKPVCPPGTVGTYPACRKVAVSDVPKKCPPGMIGKPPKCKPRHLVAKCPFGMVGTPPNCRTLAYRRHIRPTWSIGPKSSGPQQRGGSQRSTR